MRRQREEDFVDDEGEGDFNFQDPTTKKPQNSSSKQITSKFMTRTEKLAALAAAKTEEAGIQEQKGLEVVDSNLDILSTSDSRIEEEKRQNDEQIQGPEAEEKEKNAVSVQKEATKAEKPAEKPALGKPPDSKKAEKAIKEFISSLKGGGLSSWLQQK